MPFNNFLKTHLNSVTSKGHWILAIFTILMVYAVQRHLWEDNAHVISHAPWVTQQDQSFLNKSLTRLLFSIGICQGCNAYKYNRIISPSKSLCTPTYGKHPELLIIVSAIHRKRGHRHMIRKTWGSYALNNTGRVRLLFLFGKDPSRNGTEEQLLQAESTAFEDILQDDFNSTYRRGGEIQLIMGLHWVVNNCEKVAHILKVSDDTFINIPKMLDMIRTVNLSNSIWGQCLSGLIPMRDKGNKLYISEAVWPAPIFPKLCMGAYMGFTQEAIRKLLMIAPYVTGRTAIDDVLIAICAEKLGIPIHNLPGFFFWNNGTDPCKILGPKLAIHCHGCKLSILGDFWSKRDCFEKA